MKAVTPKQLYSQRFGTVEPVFANIRHNKRLTRLNHRGRVKVNTQWNLYCMVLNIEKLAKTSLGRQTVQWEGSRNNGRSCTYKFGEFLEIGIKDIGGTDTVIGFHHSDMREELYAVMYFGCIAVVPGGAHPRNYDRNYGVFISPTTGRIYSTSAECRKTL